jgi:mono/diheme cytochrome c family protein
MRAISCLFAVLALSTPLTAQEAERGAVLYADFCAVCHGVSARGDGPMAEALTLPPPDLTMLGAGGAFPLLDVARQIDGRDRLLAHGGEMPLFGPGSKGTGRMWRCRDRAASP